jgi:hypothetical protein
LYDTGALYVFAEGTPVSTTLGYLEVNYKVDLIGVNRNSGGGSAGTNRPIAEGLVNFGGLSITPTGQFPGTDWASFTGQSTTAIGNTALTSFSGNVGVIYGNVSNYVTASANNITLQPGTYKVSLTSTVVTDTYTNGTVALSNGSISIYCHHSQGALNYPTTAYAYSSTITSPVRTFTLTAPSTFVLSTNYFYSTTPITSGRTWSVAALDNQGTAATQVNFEIVDSA